MNEVDFTPKSPAEWYDLGVFYRQSGRFGDAINAFQSAADSAREQCSRIESIQEAGFAGHSQDESASETKKALETIISNALTSIGLLREINAFVNTDLMNP